MLEHVQKSIAQACLLTIQSYTELIDCMVQFIYSPLKIELNMPERQRARYYANRNYLYYFARQLWQAEVFYTKNLSGKLGFNLGDRVFLRSNWRVH